MIAKRLSAMLAVIGISLVVVAGSTASVAAKDPFQGIDCSKASNSAVCSGKTNSKENPLTGPNGTIRKVTLLVARIAGAAAVIIMMIGGFMYVTASGDAGKVSEAKKAIIYAAIGLVVIVTAQSIIIFIMSKL